MGKPKAKKWSHIGEFTHDWVKGAYPNASANDSWKYNDRMNNFLEFINTTDTEFIDSYKNAKDKNEWAKRIGFKAIAFYNHKIAEGYATNTARAEVSTVRAFCRDNAIALIVPRKKIAKAKMAKGEHEFTRDELAKMFHVADLRDKAILSTAVSLGFSMKDFAELPRDLIESLVNKAIAEKIDFIAFDYERAKTGVDSRSHLTPEARDSLKSWFEYIDKKRESEGKGKSRFVWCNGNDGHLTDQALNDIIKSLVQKANITTTGKIRFHLIRKFLMNALHDSDFSSWEVKRILGKEIPTTDATYLHGLNRKVTEMFPQVYDHIRLSGYTNKNGLRIEELEEKLQHMEIRLEQAHQENLALQQILQFAIPKEQLIKAIIETAKRIPDMNEEKLERLKNDLAYARDFEDVDRGLKNITSYYKTRREKTE